MTTKAGAVVDLRTKTRDRAHATDTALEQTSLTTVDAIQVPVSDAVADEVYEAILALKRESDIQFVMKTGKLLFEKFYGGSIDEFRARGGEKDASLRKLADKFVANEITGLSKTSLHRAVETHILDAEHRISERTRLTPRHVQAVIGLPAQKQAALLADAEEERLTTRELEERASGVREAIRRETGEKRGRPRDPTFLKSLAHLGKYYFSEDEDAFGDLDELKELDRSKIEALRRVAAAGKQKLAEIENALDAALRDRDAEEHRRPRRRSRS